MTIVFYEHPFSSYVQKAKTAFYEKGARPELALSIHLDECLECSLLDQRAHRGI